MCPMSSHRRRARLRMWCMAIFTVGRQPRRTHANKEEIMKHKVQPTKASTSRRSFLRKGLAVGGAGVIGALANRFPAVAKAARGGLTKGDVAILQFLAAAELLEADLWAQYNELGGIQDNEVPGGSGNPAYSAALQVLDSDMNQYIHDNTDDEFTHFK